jgi:hypothetical protein
MNWRGCEMKKKDWQSIENPELWERVFVEELKDFDTIIIDGSPIVVSVWRLSDCEDYRDVECESTAVSTVELNQKRFDWPNDMIVFRLVEIPKQKRFTIPGSWITPVENECVLQAEKLTESMIESGKLDKTRRGQGILFNILKDPRLRSAIFRVFLSSRNQR